MKAFKTEGSRKAAPAFDMTGNSARHEALKNKRLAHEEAQKAAGLWGEMSVGMIERDGAAFVHLWKGSSQNDVYKLAAKRPKDISKPEYDALCLWLKAGRYEGFTHSISAWNITMDEAQRIKTEVIAGLAAKGTRVVNPPE